MVLLCVDDDPEDIDIFCDALKSVDGAARCVVAYNGQEALDILRSGLLPDYVFLDINMPIMNGMETLKMMRKDRRFKKVPVIIYSTTINPVEIDQYKEAGADQFLTKPAQFHQLCHSLDAILRKGGVARPPGR